MEVMSRIERLILTNQLAMLEYAANRGETVALKRIGDAITLTRKALEGVAGSELDGKS